jgi:hypothetical protein
MLELPSPLRGGIGGATHTGAYHTSTTFSRSVALWR